jgi:hypothetical protein
MEPLCPYKVPDSLPAWGAPGLMPSIIEALLR